MEYVSACDILLVSSQLDDLLQAERIAQLGALRARLRAGQRRALLPISTHELIQPEPAQRSWLRRLFPIA